MNKASRKSEDLVRSSPVSSNASPSVPRAQPANAQASSESTVKLSGPVPRAPAGAFGASGRAVGPKARDARAPGESLADFAEFIKSTGPAGDRGPAALRNVHVPVNPPKTIPESEPLTSVSSRSTSDRNRYQAREPAANSRSETSDLIDFIRQGPANGQNPIPRHVAPFRNPEDSEMMYGAAGGRAVDPVLPDMRHSQASTNVTDYSMPSMHSSVNSNSALLKNKNMSKANAMFGEDDDDMGMPMPVRKTRRVRDPYAIDFSDEEDDDFDMAPRPPPKKEESLAEFLLNCEPPPEPPSPPTKQQQPRRKSSTPGLMGRFGRNNSKEVNTLNESQSRPGAATEARPSTVRRHVPIQMPPGYDAYGPINADPPVNRAPVERAPMERAPVNRVPMKKFEPREPAYLGQTGDLAKFLRDSEPPPDFTPAPVPVQQEEPSGFAKFFGRRRKASVV